MALIIYSQELLHDLLTQSLHADCLAGITRGSNSTWQWRQIFILHNEWQDVLSASELELETSSSSGSLPKCQ